MMWLQLIVAAPVGMLTGLAGLLGVAVLTGNLALALLSGIMLLVGQTALLARHTALHLFPTGSNLRRWIPVAITGVTALFAGAIVWVLLLAPGPSSSPPTVESVQYWDIPSGSRIAYQHTPASGSPRHIPVILVHGGPGSPSTFDASLAESLADVGFDVYNYRQVGAGLSSRLNDVRGYTVERHVADLDAVRAAIGTERVMLVGASWGGQLIANYIAAHPNRVERAVVSSPAHIWAPAFSDDT
jgi:proline iminopeptidase